MVAINALYVAAEFAAVSARRSSVQHQATEGNRTAQALLPILEDSLLLDRYVATCQIGITLSSIILGAFGQAALTLKLTPIVELLGEISKEAALSITAVAVLIGLTAFQMVLGELIPKTISLQYPNKTALLTYLPMRWSMVIFSWFIAILNGSGVMLLNLMGMRHSPHRHIHSPAELEILIAESRAGGILEADEHERLKSALKLGTKKVSDFLVPRTRIIKISATATQDEILDVLVNSAFTRFPVYRHSHDNIIGMLHAKDVATQFIKNGSLPPLKEMIRPLPSIPETISADKILTKLKKTKAHQAVVIDEHGGVEGIVTLTDVLSGVMGSVGDEFKPGQALPKRLRDGRVRLPGHMKLDVAKAWIGILWQGDCHTISGKIIEVLGRVPVPGERLKIDGVEVEVGRVKQNVVISVTAMPLQSPDGEANHV